LAVGLAAGGGAQVLLAPVCQRYRGGSAVLETVVTGDQWLVEACDFMPWGQNCLVRHLTVTNQASEPRTAHVTTNLAPIRSAAFPLELQTDEFGMTIRTTDGVAHLVLPEDGALLYPAGASRQFRVLIGYGDNAAAALCAASHAATVTSEGEERFWDQWLLPAVSAGRHLPDQWQPHYRRSLVVLKLLSCQRTGALLAAPTASFPAVPGGSDNWDYRYCWLRDGYYTAMTLDAAGLHDEAGRFYEYAFRLQGDDGHWSQPLYTIDGTAPAEFIAPDLHGPGGETPIRFGNAASGQLQLDNEGNMLHGLWFHYRTTGSLTALERHWNGVRKACEWISAHWASTENGIWELRDYRAHWVHGKAMCYTALISGARIAGALGYAEEAAAWDATAQVVRDAVVRLGFDQERQAYLRHYGDGTPRPCVDISVLALVFYGILPPNDPRILSTVALMEREQVQGGLMLYHGVCRYDYAAVPFYLPTLWLARYYLMAGRRQDCLHLLQTCMQCATDLGLMAEHFDGRNHTQWGNFPQAFSHEELARLLLEAAQEWSFHEWDQPVAGTTPWDM
ncbi:MAG TPA: glycoside hydrolase family 15 protein, partial [Symbiobacteriaceae bacterium]|nr:glycoside hydrolase family 15 protein [Symbiobacteriaceae bacterium]